jgi:hypothetical protein
MILKLEKEVKNRFSPACVKHKGVMKVNISEQEKLIGNM